MIKILHTDLLTMITSRSGKALSRFVANPSRASADM